MAKVKVFVLGATGYIGGSVIQTLFNDVDVSDIEFDLLVRQQAKIDLLKDSKLSGLNGVLGSLDDAELLEKTAAESDIILSMADADHLKSIQAILRGAKARHQKLGKPIIFIHISGTGVYLDDPSDWPKGEYNATQYTDSPAGREGFKHIKELSPKALHRNVDLELVAADKAGYIKSFIILPSTIWGIAKSNLVDIGFQNPHSIQIPGLIRAGIARGVAGVVGKGENMWPHISIHDIAQLISDIFKKALLVENIPHGEDGFFNGENGNYQYLQLAQEIGKQLHQADPKRFPSAEVKQFTDSEVGKSVPAFFGSNCRCDSTNGRGIGWKPSGSDEAFVGSIKDEVRALLQK